MDEFDYVIIGAGTAGCVLANRLSADPDVSVALLEAGGKDDYFWIDVPVGYLYTIGNPRTDWCYSIEPDPGLNGRSIGYARGKGLGGCSSINAMIYMRGQKADYDHWASLGNRGWSWDDVLPLFKRSEDYQHGADEWHGSGGELRVEERRVSWEILDAWRDAAEECGIPKIAEFNRGDNFGNAYFQMTQRRGVRWSATKAFLRSVLGRPNLTVLTDTLVERIELERRDGVLHAAGVRAVTSVSRRGRAGQRPAAAASMRHGESGTGAAGHSGEPRSIRARREVLLAAGAIGSAQILQLSGVGPGALLHSHGIEVVHELPGVGENLHDHLQIRMVYKVQGTATLNRRARTLLGKAGMALEYALFKTGPLTMPPSQLGAFARSSPEQPAANIEWHVQPLSLDKFGDPLHPFDAITPSVCNLQPTSRGHVRIRGADPRAHPAITLNYLSTEQDRRIASESMRFTRRIMAAAALERFRPEEWRPGPAVTSDEALLHAAGDLGTTIFHPVGTCRMGHDRLAVVDDTLAVHGIEGLRVVDASIMPRITSGNTNAPTVMIAEKGADLVLKAARSGGPRHRLDADAGRAVRASAADR